LNRKDLTGKQFNKLLVIKDVGRNKWGSCLWLCICSCEFKNEVIVTSNDLLRNHTGSCGCFQKSQLQKALRKNFGESAFNQYYLSYSDRCKRKNTEFQLSKDIFRQITSSNCYYCNKSPERKYYTKAKNGYYLYNTIDRVDNDKGYINENVVPCCLECNLLKSGVTIKIAEKMYEFIRRTS
jgi:hypothetical protein